LIFFAEKIDIRISSLEREYEGALGAGLMGLDILFESGKIYNVEN